MISIDQVIYMPSGGSPKYAKALQLGHAAAASGEPITANPYKVPGYWLAWRRGYETFLAAKTALLSPW